MRHAAAVWCNKTAGFEVVHGLLNRLMQMLEIPRIAAGHDKVDMGYYISETDGGVFYSVSFNVTDVLSLQIQLFSQAVPPTFTIDHLPPSHRHLEQRTASTLKPHVTSRSARWGFYIQVSCKTLKLDTHALRLNSLSSHSKER